MALGILRRGRGRMSGARPVQEERRMTVVEHLQDLRRVLIVSLVAWLVAPIVAAVFNHFLLSVLEYPLTSLLATHNRLISKPIITSPTELVTIPLKVAMVGGLLLFAGGACLAYFLMPLWLNLLTTIVGNNAIFFPDLNQYLSFLTLLIVAFGVTFELPVVIILLGLLGIVSSGWLRRHRKAIWIVILSAANLVTPGADPFTPMMLAIPLIGLFELSVVIPAKPLRR